jgi:glycine/D-amino acid oxidase-like deaminating enzyme
MVPYVVYRPNKATLQQSAWSSRLPSRIGINIPQLRVRTSVGLTGPVEPLIPVAAWSPEIAFRQRPDGVVVLARFDHADHDLTLGSLLQARRFVPTLRVSSEEISFHLGLPFIRDLADRLLPGVLGTDRARRWALGLPPTNAHSPEHALSQFKRLFAGADRLSIQDRWSCYLGITPDMLPVLGRAPGFDGLTIATGLSGHGFAMAPIVGKVTADCALGVSAKFDLSAFSASRW